LVAGFTKAGKPIHIVCGRRGDWWVIITVYILRLPKFKTPCEECEYCGERYFKADVLKRIEEDFHAIYVAGKKAKSQTSVPVEEFAEI